MQNIVFVIPSVMVSNSSEPPPISGRVFISYYFRL